MGCESVEMGTREGMEKERVMYVYRRGGRRRRIARN